MKLEELIEWDPSAYKKDKNFIYYKWEKLDWESPDNFKILKNWFWVWNYAYYDWNKIEWTDWKTFEYLDDNFYKDKDNVYYINCAINKRLEWADPKTFKVIRYKLWIDENNVFNFEKVDWADPKTFEKYLWNYYKDKNFIYFKDAWNNLKWWNDKNYKLELNPLKFKHYFNDFVWDDKNLYMEWKIIKWADPQTFESLGDWYYKDKNFVYIYNTEIEKIEWVDIETFEILDDYFSKDKNSVFYKKYKLQWANPKDFEKIDNDE